ncbi:MAG TPA: hypothetical protein VEO96_02880 [Thermoplasmata archaeon]|nr:hypothetical protein [Thermoplasmata archaeon]
MDRDRPIRDARAVEDPIAAIFDLAESVDRETPKIRKTLRYVRWFVSLWLLLDFFLIIVLSAITGFPAVTFLLFIPIVAILLGMRRISGRNGRLALLVFAGIFGALQIVSMGGLLFLGIVLVALFILGFLILELMQDLRSFFDYFALRHRVIQRVRQADPVVYVPEGKDAVQRILTYLAGTSADVRGILATPGSVAVPALLTGKTGLTYSFDAYIRQPPTPVWRVLNVGLPGFAVFVKAFDHAPTLADLQALKAAVEDVAVATRIPPARILVLWRAKKDESVTPDVYDFLTKEAVRVRIRGATFACSLELAVERADGTYDFIPLVVDSAVPSGGRPAPA